MEFPHLLRLIEENQFDTIYHEHFSTSRCSTVAARLRRARADALRRRGAADARRLAAHLRAPRRRRGARRSTARRRAAARASETPGLAALDDLRATSPSACGEIKRELLEFLIEREARRASRSSATARRPRATRSSTTAASGRDFLDYTVDRSPHKQGRFLPGHAHPDPRTRADRARRRPDYVLILPWNLKDEIIEQMATSATGAAASSSRSPRRRSATSSLRWRGVDWDCAAARRATLGEEMHDADRRALSHLPQHHRRRRARDVRESSSARLPLEITRSRAGRRSSTGRSPASGTSATPGSQTPTGARVVDFRRSNLHVLGYSVPVRRGCP